MAPQLREEWDTIKDVFSGSFTFVSSKVKESDELLIRLLKTEIDKREKREEESNFLDDREQNSAANKKWRKLNTEMDYPRNQAARVAHENCQASGIVRMQAEVELITYTLNEAPAEEPDDLQRVLNDENLNADQKKQRISQIAALTAIKATQEKNQIAAKRLKDSWCDSYLVAKQQMDDIINKKTTTRQPPSDQRIEDWYKCDEEHCTWTVAGWGDGNGHWEASIQARVKRPPMKPTDTGYEKQYLITQDIAKGIINDNGNNPRDDGRGDTGRVDRYKQAYKDHKERYHSRTAARDMIKIDAPSFTMRMDEIKFKEEKENWQRYVLRNPPSNPVMRMEMMRRSMNSELRNVMNNYIEQMNGSMEVDQVQTFLKNIEENAVIHTPNAKHLANLEAISQGAGERMMPFLSRIKSAAAKLQTQTFGSCTKETHPDLTTAECEEVTAPNGVRGPPQVPVWPCKR